MQRVPMTAKGAKALREELEKLKKEDRPRISAAIAEAREHGDLKENAEYHAAREQQGFVKAALAISKASFPMRRSSIFRLSKIPAR